MIWYYYIPHVWDSERAVWEDVYLMPNIKLSSYIREHPQSLWFTLDGYYPEDTIINGQVWEQTYLDEQEKKFMEKFGFVVRTETGDMIIKNPDFTKEELIYWAKFYLTDVKGFLVTKLIEATEEIFKELSPHSEIIEKAKHLKEEFEKNGN